MKRLLFISLLPFFALATPTEVQAKQEKTSAASKSVAHKMRALIQKVSSGCKEQQIDKDLQEIIIEETNDTQPLYRKKLPIHFKLIDMLLNTAKKNGKQLPAILRLTHKIIEFYKQLP